MSYLTIKYIKGHPYLYQVRSERRGDRVVQAFERYLGRAETANREIVEVGTRTPKTKKPIATEVTLDEALTERLQTELENARQALGFAEEQGNVTQIQEAADEIAKLERQINTREAIIREAAIGKAEVERAFRIADQPVTPEAKETPEITSDIMPHYAQETPEGLRLTVIRSGKQESDVSRGGTWYEQKFFDEQRSSYDVTGLRGGEVGVGGKGQLETEVVVTNPFYFKWTQMGEGKVILS